MQTPGRSLTLGRAETLDDRSAEVEVLLFGRLREAAGERSLSLPLPEPPTAGELWRAAVAARPGLACARSALRPAVNERFATWETELRAGDRVAFLPPMSGG